MQKSQDSGGAEVSPCMVQSVIEEYGHDASETAAAKMETAKNVAALCYEGESLLSSPIVQRSLRGR